MAAGLEAYAQGQRLGHLGEGELNRQHHGLAAFCWALREQAASKAPAQPSEAMSDSADCTLKSTRNPGPEFWHRRSWRCNDCYLANAAEVRCRTPRGGYIQSSRVKMYAVCSVSESLPCLRSEKGSSTDIGATCHVRNCLRLFVLSHDGNCRSSPINTAGLAYSCRSARHPFKHFATTWHLTASCTHWLLALASKHLPQRPPVLCPCAARKPRTSCSGLWSPRA